MKQIFMILLFVVLIPNIMFGQLKKDTKPVDIPTKLTVGQGSANGIVGFLGLDPSRLNISHAYHLSYFSGSGRDGSVGMYLNTLSYEFSKSVDMKLQWGIAHQPFGGNFSNAPKLMNSPFISAAQFRYKPSDKFQIQLDYRTMPYWQVDYYHRPYSNFDWE